MKSDDRIEPLIGRLVTTRSQQDGVTPILPRRNPSYGRVGPGGVQVDMPAKRSSELPWKRRKGVPEVAVETELQGCDPQSMG